jgi:hypothetical protein
MIIVHLPFKISHTSINIFKMILWGKCDWVCKLLTDEFIQMHFKHDDEKHIGEKIKR